MPVFIMNDVKIKFDPFQDKCVIAINDEPLPRYSPLNSHVNKSLLVSGKALLADLEGELNDEFDLVIVGTEFEKFFMGDLKQRHKDCKTLTAELIDLKQRFEQAHNHLGYSSDDYKEKVYAEPELELELDSRFAIEAASAGEATLCVAMSYEQAKEMAQAGSAALVIYVAEKSNIVYSQNGKCLWGVKPVLLQKRLQAAVERFAIPRYLEQAQQQEPEAMPEQVAVKAAVETLKSIDVHVTVRVATDALEGDILQPEYEADGNMPAIRVESQHPQVVQVRDNKLWAVGEGRATICFYKDNEIDAFETIHIHVRTNNLLKKITLVAPEEIKPGKTYNLATSFEPADSPEIEQLRWEVKDPSVVQVDQHGNIRALKAGKTVVSVKAERTIGKVEVNVLPGIEKITLSKENISLVHGKRGENKTEIEVAVEPMQCTTDKITCKSTNPKVAVAEKNEIGQWVITAKGTVSNGKGTCKLIFTDEDSGHKVSCDVTVISSIADKSKKEAYLSRTALMTLIAFVLQFFSAPLGALGAIAAGVTAAVLGVVGIVATRKSIFWELLLMAIALLIAYTNLTSL